MTIEAAAAALGISASTVRARLQRGVMRGERAGQRMWMIPRDEVERWRSRGRLAPGRKPTGGSGTGDESPLLVRLRGLRAASRAADDSTADLVNAGREERDMAW